MYDLVLLLHSWLRWPAIIAGVAATLLAFTSRPALSSSGVRVEGSAAMGRSRADRSGLVFMILLDVQFLLGLLLYGVLSPTTEAIFDDFGAAMRDPVARFWAVEHITMMLFAVVMVHVGRVLARRAATPAARRRRMLVCFALATIVMLGAIPWPGLRAGRPLFRV
jgi:hypothetical protein